MAHMLIVGSGIVGTATGKGFARKGHQVSFVDINPERVAALRAEGLAAIAYTEVDWQAVEVVLIAVSTPSMYGKVVLEHVESAAHEIGKGLAIMRNWATVVVRSTVPPTTTTQRLTPILEQASGKRAGEDFGVAMNPEFLRQASNENDFLRPWITVLGTSDERSASLLDALYRPFGALVVRCTPTEAEMIKYVNNVYNAMKISYFNEVHAICEQLGLDSNLVAAAVARSAEGMWNPLYGTRGGVPYGGACLPKDTSAFLQFAREQGFAHMMLEATIMVNEQLAERMPAAANPHLIEAILEVVRRREPSERLVSEVAL